MATEIKIDINRCRALCDDMDKHVRDLQALVNDINDKNPLLRDALGENHYKATEKTVMDMTKLIDEVGVEIDTVKKNMIKYVEDSVQITVILNDM